MTQQGLTETSQPGLKITCLTAPVTSIVAAGPVLVFRRKLLNLGWRAGNHGFFFGAADQKTWKRHTHAVRKQSNGLEALVAKNSWCLLSVGSSGIGKWDHIKKRQQHSRYIIHNHYEATYWCFSLWFLICSPFSPLSFLMSYILMSPVGSKISLQPHLRSHIKSRFPHVICCVNVHGQPCTRQSCLPLCEKGALYRRPFSLHKERKREG